MNEQYLQGYFDTYVLPAKPDADFNDWVSKISTNEQYKQGMFNSYVKPSKPDAEYLDWHTKIFGGAPQVPVSGLTPQGEEPTIFQYLADSEIPVVSQLATPIASGGKALSSFITNSIPQSFVSVDQNLTSGGLEAIRSAKTKLNDPNTIAGLESLEKQGVKIRIGGETYEQAFDRMEKEQLGEVIGQERKLQQYKNQSIKDTSGTINELSEVKNVTDFANWFGSSLGQMGAQIPLSIASLGTSSFLLESAEVYDQQLDLLSEKTGLSREEILRQGLDDGAAGQAYAILAGGLDALSAGSIISLFRKAATKELTKKTVKDVLKTIGKNTGGEFLTEGFQGQLETKGATTGAETEFNWDWKKFFNEGAAGAVGGGGLSVAGIAFEKVNKEAENDIINAEVEANNISTGDLDLDAAIDESVAFAKEQFEKEDSIEGAKVEEELTKAQQAELKAKQELERESRARLIAEKALEFERAPVVPRNLDPISQAQARQEEEALQGAAPAYVKPALSTQDTTVPKYDPKTLDEIGEQKAKSFNYDDGIGGKATGKIVGETAVLDEIFAAKDQEGNPVKGGGLYNKVVTSLKEAGVKKLRVGVQSVGSKAAINSLIKNKELTVDENGGKDIDGAPIDFFIGTPPVVKKAEPKVSTPKTKVGKAIAKAKAVKAKVVEKLVEPKVKAAPKVDLEAVAKKEAEKKEDIRVKLTNSIDTALARKPAAAVARLDQLVTKAEEAGLPELAKEIETIRTKKQDEIDTNAKERAISKALSEKRKAKVLSKAEREALTKQKKEDKKANNLIAEQKTYTTVEKGSVYSEKTTKPIKDVKFDYSKKIAEAEARGNGVLMHKLRNELENIITTYREGKKKRKLTKEEKSAIKEEVVRLSKTEAAIKEGKKIITKENTQKTNTGKELANIIKFNVKEDQDVTKFLLDYIANSKNKLFSELAKILRDKFNAHKTVTTYIGNKKYEKIRRNKAGVFTDEFGFPLIQLSSNYIQNKPAETARLFLHELVHGVTSEKIHKLEDFQKGKITQSELGLEAHEIQALEDLNNLYLKVKEQTKGVKKSKNQEYGLKNLSEFVTMSLTDSEFQQLVSTIKSDEKGKSVFDKILDYISEFLGLSDSTILNDIFRATEKLASNSPEAQARLEKAKADMNLPEFIAETPVDSEIIAQVEKEVLEDVDTQKLLDDFKKAREGDFGIEEGGIEDINFSSVGKQAVNMIIAKLEEFGISKFKRKEITAEQYVKLAPYSQTRILNGLMRVVNQYKSKTKSDTKFFTITVPKTLENKIDLGGFHMALNNSDNAYIVILVNEDGVPIHENLGRNSVLHEYLHDYTKLMFTRLYSLDKNFRSKMNRTFGVIQNEVTKQTTALFKKLETKNYTQLTEQEQALYNAIFRHIKTTSADPEILFGENGMYAFTNVDEFLSELFSDPDTVAFLSQVQMDERITSGAYKGQKKSLLYRWFEDFFDYVKKNFNLTPVQNSALDYALDSIIAYDVEFSQGELNRQEGNLVYNMLTFDKNVNKDSNPPSKTEVKSIVTKPITKNIADTLWKRKDIKTFNDVKEYVNRVNGRLEKRQQLGENYPKVIYKIIGLRRAALESNKKIKSTLDQYVANNKDKFTNKQLQDLEDFAAVDLDNLKFSDLSVFTKGYSSLIYNGEVTPEAYNIMINEGKTAHMKKAVSEIAPQLSKIGVGLTSSFANPATFSSLVGKYKEKIAGKFLSTFYGGLMQANSRANIEAHRFYTDLTTFAEKHGLKHNNLVRVGIYGSIFSTVANPETQPEAWKQEVKENAEFAVQAAEAKLQSKNDKTYRGVLIKKEIEKEIELAKEIASKVAKNRSMENILDKNEQAVYDKIRTFADTHESDFKRNAAGIWKNEELRLRYNYFPTLAQGKVGSEITSNVKSRADELIRTSADNAADALLVNDKDSAEYNKLFAKKVWSNYERLNPKGYFYEFDALAISKRWGKSLLYDIYASSELKALNKLMQDREVVKELGVPTHQAILKQLKSITSSGYTQDNEVNDLTRFIMKGRDALYTASLATAGQLLLQSSSGFVGAAVIAANINPLKAGKTMAKATKAAGLSMYPGSKLNTFLDETGLGVQLRNIGFETYLSPTDYRSSIGTSKLRKASMNATNFALQSADKFAARMVWFATFFDAGGTLENPNKEAVLKAERMVGLLQNMSDISFSAPIFKYNSTAKKILMGMFYAYKSFALNSFIALASAGPRVLKSKEARVVVTAQLGSLIAYHTLAAIAVRPFYKMIADALLGKDDDDEEEEKSYTKGDEIKTAVVWDLLVGMYAPSIVDQMARWWANEWATKKIYGNDYEEFDKYQDSPLSGPANLTDSYSSLMGPGMREPARFLEDLLKGSAMYLSQDEYFQTLEEQEKLGYAAEDFAYSTAALLMGSATYMPLRGDVKRLIEGVKNQKKRDRRKESGSGTIYDSELESDYESTDYENELEEQSLEEFLEEN